jgi:dTDP-4-dehydrorhamnose 3,5-epimerase-like enzyme
MNGKLQIRDLPITDQFRRRKRLIQERGELALIEDGAAFQHLGYFSLKAGPDWFRGGHYHERKKEHFYIIAGKLRVQLVDMDTREEEVVHLRSGQRVIIFPRCAHRFTAEEDAQVIEYYDSKYDLDDDIPYEDFPVYE